ncbi:aromatic ring-hydroxylating oxygenase subunit alpha [Falsiroseomonas stagni]|uniref:Phenylpropionate dioxygenase, large terminal subunit n=1 Tax=Falsiroseomonas stagni DSM 19981 TaxID=1123062 RepID=A0A1I4CWT5_9PROT|nr:aromatic ring-hydroxylating dioxygenase subunit alpha [Falsiroseomonas stagni]SFK84456.1 Phenylpropionate dioxygenase, large terminal subunit [Falsiroseomonas stagni DSM 19981]
MVPTRQKLLRRFWYPVMPDASLPTGKPVPFTLLGQEIVLWRAQAGAPAAIADRCPHRGAKLSLGFIDAQAPEGPALGCPYHGWAFGADGRCVKVPQAHDPTRGLKSGAKGHHAASRYGWIWVALEDPLYPIPEIQEAADPAFRQIDEFHEEWAVSGLRLMENSFDMAHISYVHAETFGILEDPRPAPVAIEHTDWGFIMRGEAPVANRGISKDLIKGAGDRTVRIIEGRWFMPFMRASRIDYPTGLTHVLVTAATPIDDRRSQICQWVYRNDTEAESPAAKVIAFDRAVTIEDKHVLESTTWDVPLTMSEELHMPSDKPGIEMRRRLLALLEEHGEAEARMPVDA